MTCASLAGFPFGFGSGRKPWFLHRLLTELWLFMTANSVILCCSASPHVYLAVPHFHMISTFLSARLPQCSTPLLTLGARSSCLRTECFVIAGFWRVNATSVSLVGEREHRFRICNRTVIVLSFTKGRSNMPLGEDLGFVFLEFERCFLQSFLTVFLWL